MQKECLECGKVLSGKKTKSCSKSCADMRHVKTARWRYGKKELLEKKCFACEKSFSSVWTKQKFCSGECCKMAQNTSRRTFFKKEARKHWIEKECTVCKKMFLPSIRNKKRSRYCSPKCLHFICSKVSWHNRRAKRLYGLETKITSQDWLEVLERDKWKCQKCGARENIEMDHIQPLSRGGQNLKANLRVLCKSCNRKNGTTFKKGHAPLNAVSHSKSP